MPELVPPSTGMCAENAVRGACLATVSGSRIATTFAGLRARGRCGLIPFITAGDPDPQTTLALLRALVLSGADLIELGVPAADAVADGPTIRRANERALRSGMDLRGVLALVEGFRAENQHTPLILMGYRESFEAFAPNCIAAAGQAGVDGLLIVDHSAEDKAAFAVSSRAAGVDPIFVLAPGASEQTIGEAARLGGGFVYCLSRPGATGSAPPEFEEIVRRLPAIRASLGLPLAVGFGIRDGAAAARIAAVADAVVIGSRIVEEIENSPRDRAPARVARFMNEIRMAIDVARAGGRAQ